MKKRKQAFIEKLRKTQKELPVFWHHFIPMGIILCLTVLVLLLSGARYTKTLAENYMEREEASFSASRADVEDAVHNLYSISESMKSTSAFRQLQDILNGVLPSSGKVVAAAAMQTAFNKSFAWEQGRPLVAESHHHKFFSHVIFAMGAGSP